MIGLMCLKELMLTKSMVLRKCIICDYWYLVDINSRRQPNVCDGCHGSMDKALVLMILQLLLLKEMIIEFVFCI